MTVPEWRQFLLVFIPLFVAVDPIGLVPVFIALTQRRSMADRRRIIRQSVCTALAVALIFILIGRWVLEAVGVTVGDFLIAGGLVLLVLAVDELRRVDTPVPDPALPDIGVVPLGVPLIAGPAVLATSLILLQTFGLALTVWSVVVNVGLVAVALLSANRLFAWLGKDGARVVSKIAHLLLMAIAVMLVRRGILFALAGLPRP